MNIKILHSWLIEYLETNAIPSSIARSLTLCGPSVERLEKVGKDYSYDIEITTNRVDTACVYGIAREAAAILPQLGFKAKLKKLEFKKISLSAIKTFPLTINADKKLTNRIMAVLITDIKNRQTPQWMKTRLETAGIRSLDAVIDITNYVMTEIGHPTHVFDFDRLSTKKIIARESRKGEKMIGLDVKTYTLPGGDIVFDDGTGKIIDLPGIMGTANSVVTPETKNIIFFLDNNDPQRMRRTSMSLGLRTVAATMNEKGVDPSLAEPALKRGLELYLQICKGKVGSKIFDLNFTPFKPKNITVGKTLINKKIGIEIKDQTMINILESLEFGVVNKKETFEVSVPSFRHLDISIPEDIVEEIARIYGYFNLPSELMTGAFPKPEPYSKFAFENKLKDLLVNLGGVEVYTLSLVSKQDVETKALHLSNPLGTDSEYLRTSLKPSLLKAAKNNTGREPFLIFEIANTYLPRVNDLPNEIMTLGVVGYQKDYREIKGIYEFIPKHLGITDQTLASGKFEVVDENLIYFEFETEKLRELYKVSPYIPKPLYPPQIEDLTVVFPKKTEIGKVIKNIYLASKLITNIDYVGSFKDAHTFRINYQSPEKTLTNQEVEEIRSRVISSLKTHFGGVVKE